VDTSQVGVDDPQHGWVFRDPLRIPYAATTSRYKTQPNLELLFRRPQRIPPLRVGGAMTLGLPYRASRRSGVNVDGVKLRAENPRDAIDALEAAGVARVQRPTAWLREHRSITSDPLAIQAVARRRRRGVWLLAVFFLAVTFFAAATLANATGLFHGPVSRWLPTASLYVLLATFALIWLANRWLANRDRRRGRSDERSDTDRTETRQV